jgi:cytochrome P450
MSNVVFDPFSRDFFDDPSETYRRLLAEAPCYHSEQWDFYALSRFADVTAASRDPRTFTSTHGLTYEQLTDPTFDVAGNRSLIMMDPPEHTRYRRLVGRAFSPRSIDEREPLVRSLMHGYLDQLMDADSFDLVEDYCGPFPAEVISAILGVPEADRQMIRHTTDMMLYREEGSAGMSDAQIEAAIQQGVYFMEFVADKRKHPGNDMCSELLEARLETEDGEWVSLTDHEVAGFCSLLGAAGAETVTKAVGSAAVLFNRHRDEWDKLVNDPAKIPNAVEEVLRYWAPSQYQGRLSAQASTWHGVTIPEGKPVFLLTGAANHDPAQFEDPDRFDIDRVQQMPISLGHGIHMCLGAALARLECRVALDEIRTRWPNFGVDESGLERVQMSNVAGYSKVPFLANV